MTLLLLQQLPKLLVREPSDGPRVAVPPRRSDLRVVGLRGVVIERA